jgi:calcineurin-like phosphoesterase family protein
MSKLLLTSDLHLGHKNILKFREGFTSQEHHDETLFENLASSINKRDSIIFLGDVAFSVEWLKRISLIKCEKKTLILGNHDLERKITMSDLMMTYDRIESLYSKRNVYYNEIK